MDINEQDSRYYTNQCSNCALTQSGPEDNYGELFKGCAANVLRGTLGALALVFYDKLLSVLME